MIQHRETSIYRRTLDLHARNLFFIFAAVLCAGVGPGTRAAFALELDWSGQFRADYNYVFDYTMDTTSNGANWDPVRGTAGGYYIPSGGNTNASFESLFLKLRPKLVVNDNIYIKTELWLGNPVYGVFGDSVPYTTDQRMFNSSASRGSVITAQRYWAEFLSDIGTVQVGRAPLNWGLGLVWNSGDGMWDRYESTGDTIRIISKFGAFSVMPSYTVYSTGNSVGGAFPGTIGSGGTETYPFQSITNGDGGVRDFTLALKYENIDDELEAGLNFIKRLGGAAQDPAYGFQGPDGAVDSFNYNIWDLYAKKRLGHFHLGVEVPITNGSLGMSSAVNPGNNGLSYNTFAVAAEVDWKVNDTWELMLKGGHAPGQPSWTGPPTSFNAFYFNPAYRLGLIMFNYQLANFAGPNTQNSPVLAGGQGQGGNAPLVSPYNNPIVNANYLLLNPMYHTDKWTFEAKFLTALADQTAQSGQAFLQTNSHQFVNSANATQNSWLGFETDLGASFQWDEYFNFKVESGIMLPGQFWAFSNSANPNLTQPVFAVATGVGVTF